MDTIQEKIKNIRPGQFYRWVFEGIKTDSRLPETRMQARKIKSRAWFGFLDSNPELARNFRAILRQLNAASLEDELFGNHEDPAGLPSKQYAFPDETTIHEKFREINTHYAFFSGANLEAAGLSFKTFFYACKLIADYIECNNTPENDLAFQNAYKIAVISGASNHDPFSIIHLLMSACQGQKPLHDALVLPIPVNNPPLQDIRGWRALIKAHPEKGLQIFQMAVDIEANTSGRAPANSAEATQIISRMTYANYEKYPELALLCKEYKLKEKHFDECLALEKTRKSFDRLPEIFVDGREAGYPGYYLLKLPLNDPRKYLLGHITNCCQSIGGHAEKCVKDIVKLETSGAYVLLKGNDQHSPLINKAIDYRHFQIVGQGYAWLSKNNNLVIDSWENLRPESDDKVIIALLPMLGKQATAQCPDMFKVTVGLGGKTPEFFCESSRNTSAEVMTKGFQYGDSRCQGLVYFDDHKFDALLAPLYEKWENLSIKPGTGRKNFFSFLLSRPGINRQYFADIEKYLLNSTFPENYLKKLFPDMWRTEWQTFHFEDFFAAARIVDAKGFFTVELNQFLLENSFESSPDIRDLHPVLQLLEDNNLLSLEILSLLQKARWRESWTRCFQGLRRLQEDKLLDFENCSLFLRSKNTWVTADLIIFLRKYNLINTGTSDRIIALLNRDISSCTLRELKDLLEKDLLTEENFMRLLCLDERICFDSAAGLLKTLARLELPLDIYFNRITKDKELLNAFKEFAPALDKQNYKGLMDARVREALSRFVRFPYYEQRITFCSLVLQRPEHAECIAMALTKWYHHADYEEQDYLLIPGVRALLLKIPAAIFTHFQFMPEFFGELLRNPAYTTLIESLITINPVDLTEGIFKKLLNEPSRHLRFIQDLENLNAWNCLDKMKYPLFETTSWLQVIREVLPKFEIHYNNGNWNHFRASPHALSLIVQFHRISSMETSPLLAGNPFDADIDKARHRIDRAVKNIRNRGICFFWDDGTSPYPKQKIVLGMLQAYVNKLIGIEALKLGLALYPEYSAGWDLHSAQLINTVLQLPEAVEKGTDFKP